MAEKVFPTVSLSEIDAHARRYRLRWPETQKSLLIGELSGRRSGSSIEYQDRKDYVPGDDIRHIDWRAYARNDRLSIKMYREEVMPVVDMLVDTSASMAADELKKNRLIELTHFFWLVALHQGARVRIHTIGAGIEPLRDPQGLAYSPFTRQESPEPLLRENRVVRQGGLKVVLSDFLFRCDPKRLASIFAQADRLVFVQVLSEFEADPKRAGFRRLIDAENETMLNIALDRTTVDRYRARLARLQEDLERALLISGGAFASLKATQAFADCPDEFLRKGILEI